MDATRFTGLCAMFAALMAAIISVWLLRDVLYDDLFYPILFANLIVTPLGLFGPSYFCSWRLLAFEVVPTSSIFGSTFLTIVVCVAIMVMDRVVIRGVAMPQGMMTEYVARALFAVAGTALATSLIVYLCHYTAVQEGVVTDARRFYRKATRRWAPKPQLVLCDSLEAEADGECAICLDLLSELPAESAQAPTSPKGVCVAGLLRMPCKHTFHGACADKWMMREVNCPVCRYEVKDLRQCQRICLRRGAREGAEKSAVDAVTIGVGQQLQREEEEEKKPPGTSVDPALNRSEEASRSRSEEEPAPPREEEPKTIVGHDVLVVSDVEPEEAEGPMSSACDASQQGTCVIVSPGRVVETL